MGDGVNPTLDYASGLFKDLVWDSLVEVLLTKLYASAPFLVVWPLSSITRGLVEMCSNKLFAILKLTIDLQAVVLLNEHHKKEFSDAVIKLKLLAKEQGLGSSDYKKAKEDAKEKLARYVHFNGTL
jgi:hypothetical protein